MRAWKQVLAAAVWAAMAGTAWAQAFPSKPVRMIIPYPPGGGADTLGRPLAQKMGEGLGQQVIVDNRGGAGGSIGMDLAAKSPPDGYTIVLPLTAQLAINPALYRKLPYDPVRDFEPVTLLGSGPYLLVVHPSLPVKSVKELVALAKAKPGQLSYASSGNGSGGHLAAELLKNMAKIDMLHVPYKGGGAAMADLFAGQVQVLFAPPASSAQHVKSGRLRALGITSTKRWDALPDVPTIAEAGVPGYESSVWYAILAPKGTPKEIVTRLNGEVVRAVKSPDYHKLLVSKAIDPVAGTPDELAAFIKSEMAKWAQVVKDAKVHVD